MALGVAEKKDYFGQSWNSDYTTVIDLKRSHSDLTSRLKFKKKKNLEHFKSRKSSQGAQGKERL